MTNPLITRNKGPDILSQVNKPPPASQRGRLVFGLDATASRQPTWDMASKLQGEMFAEAAAHGGLDIQLVYFRGADECKASRWVQRADELKAMMNDLQCKSGGTQIERILSHVLKHKTANALVYVGDAMEESADRLVGLAAEFKQAGIPIFLFHEVNEYEVSWGRPILGGPDKAKETFKEMAAASGGAYHPFDLSSAKTLRALLGAVAAYASGGLAALVAYEKKQKDAPRLAAQLKIGGPK